MLFGVFSLAFLGCKALKDSVQGYIHDVHAEQLITSNSQDGLAQYGIYLNHKGQMIDTITHGIVNKIDYLPDGIYLRQHNGSCLRVIPYLSGIKTVKSLHKLVMPNEQNKYVKLSVHTPLFEDLITHKEIVIGICDNFSHIYKYNGHYPFVYIDAQTGEILRLTDSTLMYLEYIRQYQYELEYWGINVDDLLKEWNNDIQEYNKSYKQKTYINTTHSSYVLLQDSTIHTYYEEVCPEYNYTSNYDKPKLPQVLFNFRG